jgi:mannose-6-phosphate isomerase-like protein (cupin superfamily)
MDFKEVSSDERRTIYADETILDGKEISIIKLNKGKAIGGCIHSLPEKYFILSGDVSIGTGILRVRKKAPYCGTFPSGVPHMFYAFEDSVIIECGLTIEEKGNLKDEYLLNVVKELNNE